MALRQRGGGTAEQQRRPRRPLEQLRALSGTSEIPVPHGGATAPGTGDSTVVASDGKTDLSAYPSLKDIIATIRQNAPAKGGTPGTGVAVVDGDGAGVAAAQVFHKGKTPAIRTTIDAHLQEIAEHAVKDAHLQDKPAGTVALDWHTGHILAIAHTGDDGDIAINGIKSPGSTMKIITSAALFDQAGLTTNSPAPCADSLVANSQNFHNDEGVKPAPNATITQAFTVSCNTSFIKDGFHYLVHDGDASALNKEATDVFGMGSWTIGGGVATTDPSIPSDVQGSDQAAQFIGQGKVTATPCSWHPSPPPCATRASSNRSFSPASTRPARLNGCPHAPRDTCRR